MEPGAPPNKALLHQRSETEITLADKILGDKITLLFQQAPFTAICQAIVSGVVIAALWQIYAHESLLAWLFYMIGVAIFWLFAAFNFRFKKQFFCETNWLILAELFPAMMGLGWGFCASYFMPVESHLHQIFIVIIVVGLTAGGIPFFSPIITVYVLFLFTTFVPFNIWLFWQGNIYTLLGFCGLVYMGGMLASCYYFNAFLTSAITLRYKNIDLDMLNQLLEKKVAERTHDLEKSLAITKSTLESTADGILVVGLDGNIEYYNQKFLDMWRMSKRFIENPEQEIFIDEALTLLKHPEVFLARINELHNNEYLESYDEITTNHDKVFEWHSKQHRVRHNIVGRVWSFRDITIRKQMEQQLSYQANHDLLTGLPNRTLLYDRINQGIAYARRYNTQLAILFLDIDNFKLINDNLGHGAGDQMLQEVARRLTHTTRENDTVARFGGDEFVIVYITKVYEDVLKLSESILAQIVQPMNLANKEIVVTTSIGISMFPKDGVDAAALLKNADMAMYDAKEQGRNNFKLYDEKIKQYPSKNLEMQIELRNAMASNQFFLVYQPTFDLKTRRIIGVEALIRWNHPQKGIILPLNFIPIAEESGIIVQLGEWVFREACLQNKLWQRRGLRPIRVAINVSEIQLGRENFLNVVEETLKETQLDPDYIEIELTESTLMSNKKQNLYVLKCLKELGIRLAIDDFGTGYSSLSYLREFPVNKLKIDQSFVRDCTLDHHDAAIVEAIVAMGHSLKLNVLAEGIETPEQLAFLEQCSCDEGQGFLYSQPVSANSFALLLDKDGVKSRKLSG